MEFARIGSAERQRNALAHQGRHASTAAPAFHGPTRRLHSVTTDINVLALVKGEERYIFLFDDERRSEALRTLGRFASNPELSFSWYDAAVLSQRIRHVEQQVAEEAHSLPARPRFEMPLPTDLAEDDLA
jgi:hypothetical protein